MCGEALPLGAPCGERRATVVGRGVVLARRAAGGGLDRAGQQPELLERAKGWVQRPLPRGLAIRGVLGKPAREVWGRDAAASAFVLRITAWVGLMVLLVFLFGVWFGRYA